VDDGTLIEVVDRCACLTLVADGGKQSMNDLAGLSLPIMAVGWWVRSPYPCQSGQDLIEEAADERPRKIGRQEGIGDRFRHGHWTRDRLEFARQEPMWCCITDIAFRCQSAVDEILAMGRRATLTGQFENVDEAVD